MVVKDINEYIPDGLINEMEEDRILKEKVRKWRKEKKLKKEK